MTSYTCPDANSMTRRLNQIPSSFDYLDERLYPLLVRGLAGQMVSSIGIIMVIQCAYHDFSRGMPPIVSWILQQSTPDIIRAIITDETFANETIALWNTINS